MRTIVICNQKGGIGKTTTAVNLYAALQEKGFNGLLVDCDPQCNATDTFAATYDGVATVYDILTDGCPVKTAIQHTENGDIVPGDPALREVADATAGIVDRETLLKAALAKLRGYDYVVIDTPPTQGLMLSEALMAATDVVIPIDTTRYSVQGLGAIYELIKEAQTKNKKLKLQGILVTCYDERTVIARDIISQLIPIADQLDTALFANRIRRTVKVDEAQAMRMPVVKYAPFSTAGIDYKNFTKELLRRMEK